MMAFLSMPPPPDWPARLLGGAVLPLVSLTLTLMTSSRISSGIGGFTIFDLFIPLGRFTIRNYLKVK
jgi:hypothetical protein